MVIKENINKIIKTGIASYGMSGKLFHAPFIQAHPGYELTAIVERNKNESREKYPDSKLYRSYEELLADQNIQLVVINTPVQSHFEFTRAAILAGKHIVLEKPATVHANEIEELEKLAEKNKVVLSIYQNRRYDGDYKAIKNILGEGLLGTVKEVEFRYDRYRPVFGGKQHKEGDLPGAGGLHDIGAHIIDQALQLFGEPNALFADIRIMREDVTANDYFELILFYNGFPVRLKGSVFVRESVPAYIIHGSKGSFLQQRSDMQEQQLLAGAIPSIQSWCPAPSAPDGILHTEVNGKIIREQLTSTPGNYMGYYDDLLKRLHGKAANPVPAADAVKTMKIIDAAFESAKQKKMVDF
jgi:scyllo-inositol 2-dehydrogenase (NADP+)